MSAVSLISLHTFSAQGVAFLKLSIIPLIQLIRTDAHVGIFDIRRSSSSFAEYADERFVSCTWLRMPNKKIKRARCE